MECGGDECHPLCIAPELCLQPFDVTCFEGDVGFALKSFDVGIQLSFRVVAKRPVVAISAWPMHRPTGSAKHAHNSNTALGQEPC
eukprot:1855645-Prymnesium_polylepis.2